jgi:hypothetical protein
MTETTGWPAGPWDNEPDRIEFEHVGLPCLMNRTGLGYWRGYVAVPPGHPLHGKDYDIEVDVHGAICHVPKPGEPDDVWWFGFDCAHYDDASPGMDALRLKYGNFGRHGRYRDKTYVEAEVRSLAEQLKALVTKEVT